MPPPSRPLRGPLWPRLLALVTIALFVALLGYGLLTQAPDTDIDQALAESKAVPGPSFELSVLQRGTLGPRLERALRAPLADGRVGLGELEGRPVVLNFWASWCPPCRTEAPVLEAAWRRAAPDGVLFVGLNMQDVTADARDFIGEFDISYLNIRDQSNEVATDWGLTGLPETFFLDKRARVVAHVIGAISKRQVRQGVAAAVNGRALGSLEGGDRRGTR